MVFKERTEWNGVATDRSGVVSSRSVATDRSGVVSSRGVTTDRSKMKHR